MKVILLPLKKSTWLRFLFLVFCIPAFPCFSKSAPYTGKRWKAIVFTGTQKVKGILYQVSDSSVVLMLSGDGYTEILFRDIHKIKLRPHFEKMEKVIGFLVGAGAGAAVLATAASRNREGEPAALAGIYGGLLGGIIGGGVGIAVAMPVYRLMATKTYIVRHDPPAYPLLAQKLRRRSVRQ
jgi:hypothetical protein